MNNKTDIVLNKNCLKLTASDSKNTSELNVDSENGNIKLTASGLTNTSELNVDSKKGSIKSESKDNFIETTDKSSVYSKNLIQLEALNEIRLMVGISKIIIKNNSIEFCVGNSRIKIKPDSIKHNSIDHVIKGSKNVLIQTPLEILLRSLRCKVE